MSTNSNDLNYWGLDYPPLTAYHSYITGKVSAYLNSNWTTLLESHGHESYSHKLFMRYSVLVPDIVIFFTAVVYFVWFKKESNWVRVNLKFSVIYLKYEGNHCFLSCRFLTDFLLQHLFC